MILMRLNQCFIDDALIRLIIFILLIWGVLPRPLLIWYECLTKTTRSKNVEVDIVSQHKWYKEVNLQKSVRFLYFTLLIKQNKFYHLCIYIVIFNNISMCTFTSFILFQIVILLWRIIIYTSCKILSTTLSSTSIFGINQTFWEN
jgi:hypothetical protein